MVATHIPKVDAPNIAMVMQDTSMGVIWTVQTPMLVGVQAEYSDVQFEADVAKASERLDAMANAAIEEHTQGKTRKFPA